MNTSEMISSLDHPSQSDIMTHSVLLGPSNIFEHRRCRHRPFIQEVLWITDDQTVYLPWSLAYLPWSLTYLARSFACLHIWSEDFDWNHLAIVEILILKSGLERMLTYRMSMIDDCWLVDECWLNDKCWMIGECWMIVECWMIGKCWLIGECWLFDKC